MVRLVPMTQAEFEAYLESAVQDYAQEHVRAGNWSAKKAQHLAEESFRTLLPDGPATPNQYLLTIEDEELGEKVGVLWFAAEQREFGPWAFVYDIRIYEDHRRQGYGTFALEALEVKARELGLPKVTLHVFGHNDAAREMYAKLGYQEVDLILSKQIDSPARSAEE
jgi:RimJ/RimL family protein N-acetyltransferase